MDSCSADTRPTVVIEAPMGTHKCLLHSDGRIERIPFINNQIDWKAFEEAVNKINKRKDATDENSGNRR